MKVFACLDEHESPVWLSFPSEPDEFRDALRELGFTPLDDNTIDYEEDNIPDWGVVRPVRLTVSA